ncbi:hypothetical protein NBRC110019_20450 [Neptunitalea chrysea]|uniref:Cell division protein ZipA n=2 Tax=Neptunitalea chrysea TaxID=1647581 RepID=A0A9W6B5M3_9FLAO|nr:hypothetical protein NBRC110019_20450 [Neptunitalea chrysea]
MPSNTSSFPESTGTTSNQIIEKNSYNFTPQKPVIPYTGSEDKQELTAARFRDMDVYELQQPIDYPNFKYDWITTVVPKSGKPFSVDEVSTLLHLLDDTSEKVYVMKEGSSTWQPFVLKSQREIYRKLAIGYKLYSKVQFNASKDGYSKQQLINYKAGLEANLAKLPYASLTYNYTVEQATDVSHKMAWFIHKNSKWAVIRLKADGVYKGKDVWDVMMSVGLQYGANNHFYWYNTDFENASKTYMSAWTTTPKGYFNPENIRDGKVTTNELVFGFSIPRSIAPEEIFDAMYNIAQYAQSRLGGTITPPVNTENELKQIRTVVKSLQNENMITGTGDALYLFEEDDWVE